MIQRIQSIWLLLAAAAALLSLKFSFYSGIKENNVFEQLNGQSHFLLLILAVAVVLISLFALFLYKKRKQQMQLILLAVLVQTGAIAFYFTQLKTFTSGNYALTAVLSFAVPVFLILAWMGIRKDEKIIKSMDRLR
jgi:LPXTG-motif cell wall-anchored protein